MKVFGPRPWGNWSERKIVPSPVGEPCVFCEEAIRQDDLGVLMPFMSADMKDSERPQHRDCLIHSIFARPEDQRKTRRESARATRERVDKEGPS